MEDFVISGIQQVGIGVPDVQEAWKWYRQHFGMDIRIFEESAIAELMLPYTGGQPQKRHAILALNLKGGGGFEIWQYKERKPLPPKMGIELGDLGIFAAKIKSEDVRKTHQSFKDKGLEVTRMGQDPAGNPNFFVRDIYNNLFEIIQGHVWFRKEKKLTGAAAGAVIGVTDIEKAREVYSGILRYDKVVYDESGKFNDFSDLPGGGADFRRVALTHSRPWEGGFSRIFGSSSIELVQVIGKTPKKIYEDRFWGDLGFIHLCYDITGMDRLKEICTSKGYPFTVDSYEKHETGFDMGEAAGHFSYIEDHDGTLIEFVETHKIPIIKKLGWYINLKGRDPRKPLPNWILKSLRFGRVKD